MCGNYKDCRQSVDCMGSLQSTERRRNFYLILEDERMELSSGPRSSGKLYVNESFWIQTMMYCLLISDGMISVKCGQLNFNF